MNFVCDTRSLRGKFNYFSLLDAQFYSAAFCDVLSFWESFSTPERCFSLSLCFVLLSSVSVLLHRGLLHRKLWIIWSEFSFFSLFSFFCPSPRLKLYHGFSHIFSLCVLIVKSPGSHFCPHPSVCCSSVHSELSLSALRSIKLVGSNSFAILT